MTTEITRVNENKLRGTFTKKESEVLKGICVDDSIDYLEW